MFRWVTAAQHRAHSQTVLLHLLSCMSPLDISLLWCFLSFLPFVLFSPVAQNRVLAAQPRPEMARHTGDLYQIQHILRQQFNNRVEQTSCQWGTLDNSLVNANQEMIISRHKFLTCKKGVQEHVIFKTLNKNLKYYHYEHYEQCYHVKCAPERK